MIGGTPPTCGPSFHLRLQSLDITIKSNFCLPNDQVKLTPLHNPGLFFDELSDHVLQYHAFHLQRGHGLGIIQMQDDIS